MRYVIYLYALSLKKKLVGETSVRDDNISTMVRVGGGVEIKIDKVGVQKES